MSAPSSAPFQSVQLQKHYGSLSMEMLKHLNALERIVRDSGGELEGNSFYYHASFTFFPELFNKQVNLFWCGQQARTKICEIGFNAGHSTMLMLLGREKGVPLDFTVFDIGHHPYTWPALEYMKEQFPWIKFDYIEGDSTLTMPGWISSHANQKETYDVVHVDGGHSEHCIANDIRNADQLLRPEGGILIIDDTNMPHINAHVDSFIALGKYRELPVLKSLGYEHRILEKI